MRNIQVRPVRDLRNNYAEIEAMLVGNDPVVITKNGRGSAVLLNINDFADYEEYLHVKYVAEKLKEIENDVDDPNEEGSDYKDVTKKMRSKYHGL